MRENKVNWGGGGRKEVSSVQKSESLSIYKIFPEVVIANEGRPTTCFSNVFIHKHIYILKAERRI